MNKYRPHILLLPEDDADRQIANGFVTHHAIAYSRIQIEPIAGGWGEVRDQFKREYISQLRKYPHSHVVLLIDFDEQVESRRKLFDELIPEDISPRVFVLGTRSNPESLKRSLNSLSFEKIGRLLASECENDDRVLWGNDQLLHNDAERSRLYEAVKSFLFSTDDS